MNWQLGTPAPALRGRVAGMKEWEGVEGSTAYRTCRDEGGARRDEGIHNTLMLAVAPANGVYHLSVWKGTTGVLWYIVCFSITLGPSRPPGGMVFPPSFFTPRTSSGIIYVVYVDVFY